MFALWQGHSYLLENRLSLDGSLSMMISIHRAWSVLVPLGIIFMIIYTSWTIGTMHHFPFRGKTFDKLTGRLFPWRPELPKHSGRDLLPSTRWLRSKEMVGMPWDPVRAAEQFLLRYFLAENREKGETETILVLGLQHMFAEHYLGSFTFQGFLRAKTLIFLRIPSHLLCH